MPGGKGGSCGRLGALKNIPTVAACCAKCKATAACMFFTSSPGDEMCYLNSRYAGRMPMAHGVVSGSLTSQMRGDDSRSAAAADARYESALAEARAVARVASSELKRNTGAPLAGQQLVF